MFKNIIDLVFGLPDFINNLINITDKVKRKKIGRDILSLENYIYYLKNNAIRVKQEIEKLIQQINEGEKWNLYELCSILREQRDIIVKIRGVLYNNNLGETIFRIYGFNSGVLNHLIDEKKDLVKMIEESISSGFSDESLPKTFDLDDYAQTYSYVDKEGNTHYYKTLRRFSIYRYKGKGDFKFTSKDSYKVVNHLIFLHGQIEKFDSVNKLNEAHKKIAEIIKNNFTIEEIVSDSID